MGRPGARFAEVYATGSSHETDREGSGHRIIVDSGASIHLTPRRDFFRRLLPISEPILIRGAFGKPAVAKFYGDAYIPVGGGAHVVVPGMVLCESLRDTLLSLAKLIKRGHRIDIDAEEGKGSFIDRSGAFTVPVSLHGDILTFDVEQNEVNVTTRARFRDEQQPIAAASPSEVIEEEPVSSAASDSSSSIPSSSQLAHARYGHICGRKLDQLIDSKGAEGMVTMQKHRSHKSLIAKCDACMQAKAKRDGSRSHGAQRQACRRCDRPHLHPQCPL